MDHSLKKKNKSQFPLINYLRYNFDLNLSNFINITLLSKYEIINLLVNILWLFKYFKKKKNVILTVNIFFVIHGFLWFEQPLLKIWKKKIYPFQLSLQRNRPNADQTLTLILPEPKVFSLCHHCIEPGQPAHLCSLTRLYTVDWPTFKFSPWYPLNDNRQCKKWKVDYFI